MSALLYLHLSGPADLGPVPPPPPPPARRVFRDDVRHECAAAVVYALGECTTRRAATEMLSSVSHAQQALTEACSVGLVTRRRTRDGYVYLPAPQKKRARP